MKKIEDSLFLRLEGSDIIGNKKNLLLTLESLIKAQSSIEEIKDIRKEKKEMINDLSESFKELKHEFDKLIDFLPRTEEKPKPKKKAKLILKKKNEIKSKGKKKLNSIRLSKKLTLRRELEEIRERLKALS